MATIKMIGCELPQYVTKCVKLPVINTQILLGEVLHYFQDRQITEYVKQYIVLLCIPEIKVFLQESHGYFLESKLRLLN